MKKLAKYHNKKVGVLGLGKSGKAAIKFLSYSNAIVFSFDDNVKIKGRNIQIDADENINIESKKNVRIHGKSSIFFDTPNLNTNAMTGNLAPRSVTFGGLVFRGTKVGANAISDAFTGGALESVQSIAQGKALEAAKQLKTLSGSIDTGALASQATQAQSALSNALSNFGGF